MPKIYTENHLLLYIYNELDATECNEIAEQLQLNPDLLRRYEELKESIAALNEMEEKPSETTIQIIKEYSQTYSETVTST